MVPEFAEGGGGKVGEREKKPKERRWRQRDDFFQVTVWNSEKLTYVYISVYVSNKNKITRSAIADV